MKICKKCGEEKELSEFGKRKNTKDGLHLYCKLCIKKETKERKEYRKEYNKNNKQNIKKYSRLYYQKNKDFLQEYMKEYYINNIEYYSEYNNQKTKEDIFNNNQKQIKKGYKKEWSKRKYNNDPIFKLSQLLRIRLLDAIKNKKNKHKNIIYLLGCSINELKLYLESQFKPEMNWSNHGEIWEIDHIKPCSLFNLENEKEQKECFHFSNLQPLFKTTEIAKSFGYLNEIGNRNKKNL